MLGEALSGLPCGLERLRMPSAMAEAQPACSIRTSRLRSRPGCRRVDHLFDRGDLGGWEAADLRVLADDAFIFCKVDAERLVVGDVAFDPLNVGSKPAQRFVRLSCGAAQLLPLQRADLRNIALDHESAQGHGASLLSPDVCDCTAGYRTGSITCS